jgi:murein DD-endopeptidase MepM/ murein hydrolase activator NlpD
MMMFYKKINALLLFSFSFFSIYAQNYRFPLDRHLSMSANFGELRASHFHSGIDLRVGGAPGAKVYAIESGYVSRIYVSGVGYGKALYIEHPDGQTSVYAHLDRFAGKIAEYVEEYQYRRQRFYVNDYTDTTLLPVQKGDVIGYAGNTGSSFGAHLHFEIRESGFQAPINPVTKGYIIPNDNMPPVFHRIAIFTLDTINDVTRSRLLKSERMLKKTKGFVPEKTATFEVCNPVFIGVNANDYQPENTSRHGIYRMNAYLDDELFYSFKIDGFEFKYTKYINSFIAYDELVDNNITYIKTYTEDGNKTPFYGNVKNKGLLILKDTLPHNVRIELFDDSQNKSTADFKIRQNAKVETKHQTVNPARFITMQWNSVFEYFEDELEIHIEPESLYSNALFKASKTEIPADGYSHLWNIGYENIPLHNAMKLKIKPVNLPAHLKDHAFIARQNKNGSVSYCGGQFDANGFLVTEASFGSYFITADTIPPKVSVNAKSNNFSASTKLTVTLDDNISGIKSCSGYIDGEWVLFEHDPKSKSMTYLFNKKQLGEKGKKRQLKVIATDNCNNTAEFVYSFTY